MNSMIHMYIHSLVRSKYFMMWSGEKVQGICVYVNITGSIITLSSF